MTFIADIAYIDGVRKQWNTYIDEGLLEAVRRRAHDEARPLGSLVNDALCLYMASTVAAYRYGAPDATLATPYRDPDNPALLYERPAAVRKLRHSTIPITGER